MTNASKGVMLTEGMQDPELNKFVRILIISEDIYAVYLDNNVNVQWWTKEKKTEDLGKILTKVAILELESSFMQPSKIVEFIADRLFWIKNKAKFTDYFRDRDLEKIRAVLGESIARIFDDKDIDLAHSALDEAKALIAAKNAEYSRRWYFGHANWMVRITLAVILSTWVTRDFFMTMLGKNGFETIFCSLFGIIGAYAFIATRGKALKLNALAGSSVHRLESTARLSIGCISAALVTLSIKVGLILSTFTNAQDLKFMIISAVLAGYAEKFIPNLITKYEEQTKDKPAE